MRFLIERRNFQRLLGGRNRLFESIVAQVKRGELGGDFSRQRIELDGFVVCGDRAGNVLVLFEVMSDEKLFVGLGDLGRRGGRRTSSLRRHHRRDREAHDGQQRSELHRWNCSTKAGRCHIFP
jgi:hypothetical protein